MKTNICEVNGCNRNFATEDEKEEHEMFVLHCTNCGTSTETQITAENIHEECEFCQLERELNDQYGAGLEV